MVHWYPNSLEMNIVQYIANIMMYPYNIFILYTHYAHDVNGISTRHPSPSRSHSLACIYTYYESSRVRPGLCIFYVHTRYTSLAYYKILCVIITIYRRTALYCIRSILYQYVCDKNIYLCIILLRSVYKRYLLIFSGDTVSLEAIAQQREIGIKVICLTIS